MQSSRERSSIGTVVAGARNPLIIVISISRAWEGPRDLTKMVTFTTQFMHIRLGEHYGKMIRARRPVYLL